MERSTSSTSPSSGLSAVQFSTQKSIGVIDPEGPEKYYNTEVLQGKMKTYIEKFKVTIKTIAQNKKDTTKYRHVFVQVKNGGAAQDMQIKEHDEILVVNAEIWARDESHEVIVGLFNNAPVDGRTRFSVVLKRRKSNSYCPGTNDESLDESLDEGDLEIEQDCGENTDTSIVTIDTSAILKSSEDGTKVDKKDFKIIPKTVDIHGANVRRFRVTGTPGYYLKVENKKVYAEPLQHNDEISVINFNTEFTGAEHIKFFTTLQGHDKYYIAINSKKHVLASKDEGIFRFRRIGYGLISFQSFSHEPRFLAGNLKSQGKIIARSKEFFFEEFPLDDETENELCL